MSSDYFHRVARETKTRFWINNPSGPEIESAIAAGAINCTTNPAYCSKLIQSDQNYLHSVIDREIRETDDNEVAAIRVYREVASRVMTRFQPLYDQSSGRYGYVTIQDDPRMDENPESVIRAALHNRTLGKNFMAKIPVIHSGLDALRVCIEENVPICATEVFSISQAITVCDLYQQEIERTENCPPFFVTHITGIFDEYLEKVAKRERINISSEVLSQAGCAIARKEYKLLKERGYQTTLLGGGARGLHHFTEMVGGDVHVTINWSTAQELLDINGPVVNRMDIEPQQSIIDELSDKFEDFRKAYFEDELTLEEFANFGPVQLFRNAFLKGTYLLLAEIISRRHQLAL
jgi:transaldolase